MTRRNGRRSPFVAVVHNHQLNLVQPGNRLLDLLESLFGVHNQWRVSVRRLRFRLGNLRCETLLFFHTAECRHPSYQVKRYSRSTKPAISTTTFPQVRPRLESLDVLRAMLAPGTPHRFHVAALARSSALALNRDNPATIAAHHPANHRLQPPFTKPSTRLFGAFISPVQRLNVSPSKTPFYSRMANNTR